MRLADSQADLTDLQAVFLLAALEHQAAQQDRARGQLAAAHADRIVLGLAHLLGATTRAPDRAGDHHQALLEHVKQRGR